jgi:hypothetical protein
MRRVGGVVTQGSAKPRTPVQIRYVPPMIIFNIIKLTNCRASGGIGIRDGLKIRWP